MNTFIDSPCGHGKFLDLIPQDSWSDLTEEEVKKGEELGHARWGLITVVHQGGKRLECCSVDEGEYQTFEEAQAAARQQKVLMDRAVTQALAILEVAHKEAYAVANVGVGELARLREWLDEQKQHGKPCSEPLCYATGRTFWLVEEEGERVLCPRHLRGKKILDHRGLEVVYELALPTSGDWVPHPSFSPAGPCWKCGQAVPLRPDGKLDLHSVPDVLGDCEGVGSDPAWEAVS